MTAYRQAAAEEQAGDENPVPISAAARRGHMDKPWETGAGVRSRPREAGAARPIPFPLERQACAFSLISATLRADVSPSLLTPGEWVLPR